MTTDPTDTGRKMADMLKAGETVLNRNNVVASSIEPPQGQEGTPRTDAFLLEQMRDELYSPPKLVEHARTLERELSACRAELERVTATCEEFARRSVESRLAQQAAPGAGERDGYCWLIECNDDTKDGPHYWNGNSGAGLYSPWTTDPFKAIRFIRQEDAKTVAINHSGGNWKAVCHHFDDAPAPDSQAEGPTRIEGPLPGETVERARLAGDYSAVPDLVDPPKPSKKPLEERLQLAAYACKVAHLLGPQAAIVDALAELRALKTKGGKDG
jgi:hypothetical protein